MIINFLFHQKRTALGFIGWAAFVLPVVLKPQPIVNAFKIIPDLLMIITGIWLFIRNNSIIVHYIILTCEVYRGHVSEGNQTLVKIVCQYMSKVDGRMPKLSKHNQIKVDCVLVEQTKIIRLVTMSNKDLIPKIMFFVLLATFPSHIMLTHRFVFITKSVIVTPTFQLQSTLRNLEKKVKASCLKAVAFFTFSKLPKVDCSKYAK